MDTNQYMEMFLEESREHLQSLNDGLLGLENDPEDLSILNDIFRNAHTIKGMSATMGYTKIAELTHDTENVLDLLRKEQLKVSEDIVDTLFKCVDSLEQMVESIGEGGPEDVVDVTEIAAKLSALVKGEAAPAAAAAAPAAPAAEAPAAPSIEYDDTDKDVINQALGSGMRVLHINVALTESCVLKSARSYMVMNALDQLGDVMKSIPPAEDLEQEKFEHSFDVVFVTDAEPSTVEETLMAISEVDKVVITDVAEELKAQEAAAKAPAAPATAAAPAAAPAPAPAAAKPAPAKKAAAPAKGAEKKAPKGSQSVRVDIEKLDNLLNLVGELVINKVRLEQIGITHRLAELTETLEQMDRVTTDLQTVVMKVRMVPVGQVFNRFPRMVRDLAKELGVLDKVKFVGNLSADKMPEYYDSLDLYVQPSKQEGLPRAVIEAMSRGCPVIGTSIAGIPELIPKVCLFRKGSTDEVVKAVQRVLGTDLEKLAKKNFAKSCEFSREKLIRKREKFYDGFLAEYKK